MWLRKSYFYFLLLMFFLFQLNAQEVKCDNIDFSWLNENEVLITYDLMGEMDSKYDVTILLIMTDEPGYQVEVKSGYGDFGSGIKTGINKRVVWRIYDDLENIQEGADYYFAIDVEESGGAGWLYYVLGGAAAVITGVLVLGGGDDGGTTPVTGSFPLPPAR